MLACWKQIGEDSRVIYRNVVEETDYRFKMWDDIRQMSQLFYTPKLAWSGLGIKVIKLKDVNLEKAVPSC